MLSKEQIDCLVSDLHVAAPESSAEINALRDMAMRSLDAGWVSGEPVAYLVDSVTRGRFVTTHKDEAYGMSGLFRADKVTPLYAAPSAQRDHDASTGNT